MRRAVLITLILFSFSRISSQNKEENAEVKVIHCSSFGISKPLREINEFVSSAADENDREESNDRLNRPPQTFIYHAKDGVEYGEDLAVRQTTMGSRPPLGPIANWAGQSGNAYPPDPTGAVGPSHYVQGVNSTSIKIFNKTTGAQIGSVISLGQLWSPAITNQGDVIVLYDKYADRWFLSQFGGGTPSKIYIAISTSPDPTGTYYTYTFSSTDFPDYLKFSIWDDGYYMTSNQTTAKVFCFERDQMLLGNSAARAISTTFNKGTVSSFFIPLPADADGQLPPANTPLPFFAYYDNAWGGGADAIKIWSMYVNWAITPTATITATPTVVPTSAFDASYDLNWNDIPQHGTTQRLDGLGGVCMFRAQWRVWSGYNSVVLNFAVQVSANPIQRGIRWCELRQDQITNQWTLYQEGTYSPDALCRWNGSIAMDGNGSIGLCYALCDSATSVYPSLGFTGRLATDPLGTMTFTEKVVINGSGAQTANNRFGDYSHTCIDPTDDHTFWHTGEYFVSGVPSTRIYTFQLPLGAGISSYENGNAVVNAFQTGNTITVIGTNLPTNDELVVDLFDAGGKQISGRKIIPMSNSFELTIDAAALAKGTYLVRLGKINSSFQRVKKIIIK